MERPRIIIFDGICNFCNGSVNFIIQRDPGKKFKFTPMQSDVAKKLIEEHGVPEVGVETFLLIKNGVCFVRTDAALEIAKDLVQPWPIFRIFRVFPRSVRDYFYKLFARNRYKLFGKRDVCMMPTPAFKNRFIE